MKRRTAWLIASILIGVVTLRGAWISFPPAGDEIQRGLFELDAEGRTSVTLDPESVGYGLAPPSPAFSSYYVTLVGGMTASVALREGDTLRVAGKNQALPPYVVVGWRVPGRSPTLSRFDGGLRLAVEEGRLHLVEWDAASPWREDQRWLAALAAACAVPEDEGALSVTRAPGRLELALGRCRGSVDFPADAPGRSAVAFVSGGTGWYRLFKEGSRRLNTEFSPPAFGFVLLLAAAESLVFWAGFGMPALLVARVVIFLASLATDVLLAMVVWWLAVLAAAAVLVLRLLRRRLTVPAPVAAVGLVLAVFFLVLGIRWLGSDLSGRDRVPDEERRGAAPQCLLTGYSLSMNHDILPGTPGTWEELADHCAPCRGGAARIGRTSETLPFIRDVVCESAKRGGPPQVVFLGGNNDDTQYELNKSPLFFMVRLAYSLVQAARSYKAPDMSRFLQMIDASVERSFLYLAEQEEMIRETAGCAQRNGGNFWLAHDFLFFDVARGRSPARQEMLQRRRAAVESAGGHFVDLFAELGDRVGISWFNDPLHMSTIGHREIAGAICRSLVAGTTGGSAEPAPPAAP